MKILIKSDIVGTVHTKGGSSAISERFIDNAPDDWDLLWSEFPGDYNRRPSNYQEYLSKVRNGNISLHFGPTPKLLETWRDVEESAKKPLDPTYGMFQLEPMVPEVEVIFTPLFCPKSKLEVYQYVRTIYWYWKTNPDVFVFEVDADRSTFWHNLRDQMMGFIKPGHYWTVTPYVDKLFPYQLQMDYGIDPKRFMPVNANPSVDFAFAGTGIEREKKAVKFFNPLAERFSVVVYGAWTSIRDKMPNVAFYPAVTTSEYHAVMADCLASMCIVRPSYEPIGLFPLRVFEVPEAGSIQIMDGDIRRAADAVGSKFVVNTGKELVELIGWLKELAPEQYAELVSAQRNLQVEKYHIKNEMAKLQQAFHDLKIS